MEEKYTTISDQDLAWEIPEYNKHQRSRSWYIIAGLVVLFFILASTITPNFFFDAPNYLFVGLVVLGAFVMLMIDKSEPQQIIFAIGDEGVTLGRKFYDYDEIHNFSIVYKPRTGVKRLYLEFKSAVRQRLSIPLLDQNPLVVRDALLRFLPEDLERTEQPTSEGIAKLLKL
jgi:hypothetical protein